MVRKIRRVVTGFQENGRSTFIADDTLSPMGEDPNWPTRGVTSIWNIAKLPTSNADNVLPETHLPPMVLPMPGGMTFIIMHIPPESELAQMPAEQRARASVPVARTFDGAYELDTTQGYHMHGTNTLDMCVILKGEVTFLVDDGEVTLKEFDTIIDRGANHGWVNRGTETCIVACAVVDAEAVDRSIYNNTMVKSEA